jgi:hypothetical protein
VLSRDARIGTVLLETNGTLSIAYRVRGLYPNDVWSRSRMTYTRFHCVGGRLIATLASDASLFRGRQTVTARSGDAKVAVTFKPTATASLAVPLHPGKNGTCTAIFTVDRTAIPALVERGNRDTRALGARFLSFRYTPR